MSARKKIAILLLLMQPCIVIYANTVINQHKTNSNYTMSVEVLANELGYINSSDNNCCGYYVDEPFLFDVVNKKPTKTVSISSEYGTVSRKSTSILEKDVTVIKFRQQMKSQKAYLYRDPKTFKLSKMDLLEHVHLSEPNTFVIADTAFYDFNSEQKILNNVTYRTALNQRKFVGAQEIPVSKTNTQRRVTTVTAWGRATQFAQNQPDIYDLTNASFTTCPPVKPSWEIRAKTIELNKVTGRGYATHARFYIKGCPVLYFPYINFSIDGQRKSGFLWPKIGGSNKWGPNVLVPYYWNMAPNYDMVLTGGILTKRGFQFSDYFRYLTTTSRGDINLSFIPYDRAFADFQSDTKKNPPDINTIKTQPLSVTNAELLRLYNSNTMRAGISWRDSSRYNKHWSSELDFNYVTDDYYYRDYSKNLYEISANYLLQEFDLFYKNEHWNFTGRIQRYQTLHPFDEPLVLNQYQRLPQLILNADYPHQALGLDYFIQNEVTHFNITQTPGIEKDLPLGNRFHTQPGIALPFYWPYFYINPRIQLALTGYNLYNTRDTKTPTNIRRAVPIFDIASGFAFERETTFLKTPFRQTLEPQFYYTYIPYRDQSDIPIFDTTVNTLLYDQLFVYNRFSGIDRIGDANQLAVGVSSRFINSDSGLEKIRIGIGEIFYFANRRVTLCQSGCSDNPENPSNEYRLSPLTALLTYQVNPLWSFNTNVLWSPITKQLDNATVTFHYQRSPRYILNLAFSYARKGDVLSGIATDDSSNNLKVTTISMAYPVTQDVTFVGLWSQNWNHRHLQNLLYGVQYETCCWAMRLVGGKAFDRYDTTDKTFKFNNAVYLEFSLKGVGNVGSGSPDKLLSNITGYNTQFGQDI